MQVRISLLNRAGRSTVPHELLTEIIDESRNSVVAEVAASQVEELRKRGYTVVELPTATTISIGDAQIDPTRASDLAGLGAPSVLGLDTIPASERGKRPA